MGRIVATFPDGSVLEYDQGSFDNWCVYLTRPGQERYPPKDTQYFQRLEVYAAKYGGDRLYADFVAIYDLTAREPDSSVVEKIKELSGRYGEDALEVAIDFTIIYLGMIAEENKAKSRLGKRIKRLGVCQVLKEGIPYHVAANSSRGRVWRDLSKECEARGF